MKEAEKLSLEEIRAFLGASEGVGFEGRKREEMYEWVNGTLRQQGFENMKRSARGIVRRYLEKLTGLSRAQVTRLITLLSEWRGGKSESLSPAPLYAAVHARGCGVLCK